MPGPRGEPGTDGTRESLHRGGQLVGDGSPPVEEAEFFVASPLSISLPSFMKHMRSLESCGLITTEKSGRVRTCVLNQNRFHLLTGWLEEQRRIWEESTDRLGQFVTQEES